ncbi:MULTISPECIES: terminase gpA endonuclease subunit [unclassified Bradyrhizobium]|uniref:terminase gpA endonuclease subunit n=1 Tax=unclassified Bradyrhizobium TaxID=2631580 RepID=UPI002915C831|nr:MULTISPECIES: terminase gpA endonuclease subunit [unclassified Bradyrhizobium]
MTDRIDIIDCATLDEFWETMSPIGARFGGQHDRFIFRGQAKSEWLLVPKVFRKSEIDKYKRGMMSTLGDHPGQFFFEWSLLQGFIRYCDATGLSVPGDSMEFRAYFDQNNITNIHGITNNDWPHDRVVPLMGMAQHHGIPTRLLDWSSNPYVACYHAAASVVIDRDRDKVSPQERIALFALDLNTLPRISGLKHRTVPGSTSVNLYSQAGSFLLVDNSGYRGEPFTPDVSVESKLGPHSDLLKKLTLPTTFAGDLLLRCHRFGVSAASIFPGYDGVGNPDSIYGRREEYDASVVLPFGVGTITASVDIQDDRAEIEWCGWGADDESWSLDYKVHYGVPNTPGFWEVIDNALLRMFQHPAGITMRVEAACIDSGGHFTQHVYNFVRPRMARRVYAIKGIGGPGRPIWPVKGTVNKAKNVTIFVLGVDQAKDMHYKRLELKEPGPGYCHFPLAEHYDKSYFDGLTAEKAILKTDKRGFTVKEWHKVQQRNEPLDLRVYNIAARLSLGINMERRLMALRAAAAQALNAAPVQAQANAALEPAPNRSEESSAPSNPYAPRRRIRSRGVES